jgi:hypothetical protein
MLNLRFSQQETNIKPAASIAVRFMLVSYLAYSSTLKMEAVCNSEPVDFCWTTLCHILEARTLLDSLNV